MDYKIESIDASKSFEEQTIVKEKEETVVTKEVFQPAVLLAEKDRNLQQIDGLVKRNEWIDSKLADVEPLRVTHEEAVAQKIELEVA